MGAPGDHSPHLPPAVSRGPPWPDRRATRLSIVQHQVPEPEPDRRPGYPAGVFVPGPRQPAVRQAGTTATVAPHARAETLATGRHGGHAMGRHRVEWPASKMSSLQPCIMPVMVGCESSAFMLESRAERTNGYRVSFDCRAVTVCNETSVPGVGRHPLAGVQACLMAGLCPSRASVIADPPVTCSCRPIRRLPAARQAPRLPRQLQPILRRLATPTPSHPHPRQDRGRPVVVTPPTQEMRRRPSGVPVARGIRTVTAASPARSSSDNRRGGANQRREGAASSLSPALATVSIRTEVMLLTKTVCVLPLPGSSARVLTAAASSLRCLTSGAALCVMYWSVA